MNAVRAKIARVTRALPETKVRILLEFAQWLADRPEALTPRELKSMKRGERQIAGGDYVWWRAVRRT